MGDESDMGSAAPRRTGSDRDVLADVGDGMESVSCYKICSVICMHPRLTISPLGDVEFRISGVVQEDFAGEHYFRAASKAARDTWVRLLRFAVEKLTDTVRRDVAKHRVDVLPAEAGTLRNVHVPSRQRRFGETM